MTVEKLGSLGSHTSRTNMADFAFLLRDALGVEPDRVLHEGYATRNHSSELQLQDVSDPGEQRFEADPSTGRFCCAVVYIIGIVLVISGQNIMRAVARWRSSNLCRMLRAWLQQLVMDEQAQEQREVAAIAFRNRQGNANIPQQLDIRPYIY